MYTRTVELSRLGAAMARGVGEQRHHIRAYEDVVVALANTTDPFSIPAAPDHYAGYEKESVCFVEPMVRFTPRKTILPRPSARPPASRSRVLQCTSSARVPKTHARASAPSRVERDD